VVKPLEMLHIRLEREEWGGKSGREEWGAKSREGRVGRQEWGGKSGERQWLTCTSSAGKGFDSTSSCR